MKRNQILAIMKNLSSSQGFYGRLLRDLSELKERDPEAHESVMLELEAQNFKDSVDLVLFIET